MLAASFSLKNGKAELAKIGDEVGFKRSPHGLLAMVGDTAIGFVPPRYQRGIEAKSYSYATVTSVEDDLVVSLFKDSIFDGENGRLILGRELITFDPSDGSEERKSDLVGVSASLESGEELQSRVTVTRLLLFGVYAFGAKKKRGGEKFIVVNGPNCFWALEVKGQDANAAMSFVAEINQAAKSVGDNHDTALPASTVAHTDSSDAGLFIDELERLVSLRREGMLTDAEFSAAKSKLLGL